jgi:hypothetical protein
MAIALAVSANAATVTWTLTSGNGACSLGSGVNLLDCSGLDGTDGNERTFTVNIAGEDRVLKARAFTTSNSNGSGPFVPAYLGQYTGGLGVTAPGSVGSGGDGSGGSNQHTVDNIGKDDLVVFEFPNPAYIPLSVFLSAFGDTDITAWVGGVGKTFGAFTSLSYATLAVNGFTQFTSANADLTGGFSSRTANLNKTGLDLSGTYLVIGARAGQWNDKFKIKHLTAGGR